MHGNVVTLGVAKYRVDKKKVNFDLVKLERCGLSKGVQHIANNTF